MTAAHRLPMEIILHIIDSVPDGGTIYHPSDPVTKTLLSFTLVCRAVRTAASNNLRRHCMYIEDEKRLADCIANLKATNHLVPEYNAGSVEDAEHASPRVRLWPITNLYLAPFFDVVTRQQTLTHLGELCALIGPSLTRLVLDIPYWYFLEKWELGDDGVIREWPCESIIFQALSSLSELEDVVLVRDANEFQRHYRFMTSSPASSPATHHVRTRDVMVAGKFWPNLRRLALHSSNISDYFWHGVRTAEQLETLILVRPSWTVRDCGCLKTAFLRTTPVDRERPETGIATLELPRPINIVFAEIGMTSVRQTLLAGAPNWPSIDPDNRIKLSLYNFPITDPPTRRGSCEPACDYVRNAALQNEIWTWKGETMGETDDKAAA